MANIVMTNGHLGAGLYSPRVASRVARIRYQSFQAWAKANLLKATRVQVGKKVESTYTYDDLLKLRLIARLRDQGARAKDIRAALVTVECIAQGDPGAWKKATFLFHLDSRAVVAILSDPSEWSPLNASKGPQKMALVFCPELIRELGDELVPPDRFPLIEINPEVLGGSPVIKGTRISTRAVAEVKESGSDPMEAYPTLTEQQIRNAQEYEKFLKAA